MNNKARYARSIAQILCGLNLLMVLTGLILFLVFGFGEQPSGEYSQFETYSLALTTILTATAYSVMALLVINRQPSHAVGWIFLVTGFAPAMATFSYALADTIASNSGLVNELGFWFGELAFIPTYTVPITLVLQYFPTGRLPSRRWRLLPVLTIFAILGMVVARAFHPWPWEDAGIYAVSNPLGISGSERFLEQLNSLASFVIIPCLLASLAAVVIRYRRSVGNERMQMKWLAYAAVIGVLAILTIEGSLVIAPLLNIDLPEGTRYASGLVFFLMPTLLSLAIGIAILRHHLFDIDIIIRKTLLYAILTGILVLVYLGLVVTLQFIFSSAGNQQSPIFIVISTLVIAGLFNPLRRRIQEIIDRRFYRKKYQAEQALAQFAAAARDEVDLEALSTALLSVVQETIQPETISLWLTGSESERSQ